MTKSKSKVKPLHGTIDSVSMSHLCRTPALRIRGKSQPPMLGIKKIGDALSENRLQLFIDNAQGLSDEWIKTCSNEMIFPILTKWIDVGGIVFCEPLTMPATLNKKLRQAAFLDAGDKLVVRIGMAAATLHGSNPFHIATNDGDFWDPKDGKQTGRPSAVVASILSEHNIESTILEDFFSLIN